MDSFPWSREAEIAPDPVGILLPDLESLLDMVYVTRLPQHQILAKLAHLRTLTGPGHPRSLELQGLQASVRDSLLRVLFFHLTKGQLPKLRDLQSRDFLAVYPKARREKLLLGLDELLGKSDLDSDLRTVVDEARGCLLRIYGDEMDGE